ncbi:Major facilitator sugar transporter-like protein [Dioscorea alata]|uniref:Major facilitator sugar transporter-like protein n=1 Tax=Dioscorea alata TaxID=55571 RepID=A0ACB7VEA6_DIOAL|nr:Major facilitator sugar transporter-like protein [Dioscorea alata]
MDNQVPSKPSECNEKIGVDEMLQRYAGEFGPWQLRHFMLTSVAWTLGAFQGMAVVFADHRPKWRCTSGGACPETMCGLPHDAWEWDGGRRTSTVAEWDLVCKDKYKAGIPQFAFFVGCLIGNGTFGHLSDSFLGRKRALALACAMGATFGFLTSLSPSLYFYTLFRFLTGVSTGGAGTSVFILTTEPIGPSKRGTMGICTFYFYAIGTILLPIISYFHHSWRSLYIITSIPSVLFLIFIIPFISESPRWFLVRHKITNAMKVMQDIAKSNGKQIPDGVSLSLDCGTDQTVVSGSIIDVIHSPVTRLRFILAVSINFLCYLAYYGLGLNVMNLKTNLYLGVILNGVAEMPAYILTVVALKWVGRRPLTVGMMLFSGVACGVGSLMGDVGMVRKLRMMCAVMGIFAMTSTYNLLFVYASELFPTVVRSAAVGCISQAGQIGAMVATFVVVMGGRWPFIVFAICGVVGGVLAWLLQETLNQPLYDTMGGLEKGELQKSEAARDG